MMRKQALLALAVVLLTGSTSAWAIQFKHSAFNWKAYGGKTYYIDLNQFVIEVDRSLPIHWSADGLPKWMKLDPDSGVISGNAGEESTTEMFSLFAVQGDSADVANVVLTVEPSNAHIHNRPVWLTSKVVIEGCVGRAIATHDFVNSVMLSNLGVTLPLPTIEISALGVPAWVIEIRKRGAYFLSGVPTAPGETEFQLQACAAGNCTAVPAVVRVKQCS